LGGPLRKRQNGHGRVASFVCLASAAVCLMSAGCTGNAASSSNASSLSNRTSTTRFPEVGSHWTAAIEFNVCGLVQPSLPKNPQVSRNFGLTTSGDGLINVSPRSQSEAGQRATFARFVAEYPGLKVSPTLLVLPSATTPSRVFKSGQTCPAGTPDAGQTADIEIWAWPSITSAMAIHYRAPANLELKQGEMIVVGVVPAGTKLRRSAALVELLFIALAHHAGSSGAPKS
jgi:hypothetical protein